VKIFIGSALEYSSFPERKERAMAKKTSSAKRVLKDEIPSISEGIRFPHGLKSVLRITNMDE